MLFFSIGDEADAPESKDTILEKCLKKIASGNTNEIGKIYDLTKNQLYGYVLSILKNPEDAEDIIQDTYIKVCQNASMYHTEGKPMAWIYTIARNLSLMKLRGNSKYTDMEDFEWEQISTDNHNFHVEDRMVLSAALGKLSDLESQIVMLHAVGGMKHREIADMYDMPLATVLSKYNRAIKKMKNELEK